MLICFIVWYTQNEFYLPFSCAHLSRVNVDPFKQPKPQFTWRSIKAVGATYDHRNLEILEYLQSMGALMIRGTIPKDKRILSPVSRFFVQLAYQISDEHGHHLRFSVYLGESNIALTVVVKSKNHRNSGWPIFHWYWICCTWKLPLHSPEVFHAKPSLIYVDDPGLGHGELYVLLGPLLSQDKILCWVLVQNDRLHFPPAQTKIIFHDCSDLFLSGLETQGWLELIPNSFHGINE